MTFYDESLQKLQEQIARKRQLESKAAELNSQRHFLSSRVRELEAMKLEEQADVDRLEGRSLAAFFYNVIGKMDEKLTKEREEAYAARVKYDAAVRELAGVDVDLERCKSELAGLYHCEEKYQRTLEEKAFAIKAFGGAPAEEILKLEERIAFLDSQQLELHEAISAGNSALGTTNEILFSLNSADDWGTLDMFGGGLFSSMAKHSHLDAAQGQIEHLQSQLRCFKTELADVSILSDIQINIDGFLRFADFFFDGLFVDWAVQNQIHQSREQVLSTHSQITSVLAQLDSILYEAEKEQNALKDKLDTLIRITHLPL